MLLPAPDKILAGVAFFPDKKMSWDFVMSTKASINAASLEYFDHNALELLRPDYPNIPKDALSAIFFEQEISNNEEISALFKWTKLFEQFNIDEGRVWFSTGSKDLEAFREFRHRLPERVNEIVKKNGFAKTGTDIAVPAVNFLEMLDFYYEKLDPSKIQHLVFGHIGESHIHANLLPANEDEFKNSKEIYMEFVKKAVSLGGTISAEHGIGKVKHDFIKEMLGEKGIQELVRVKKTLDPAAILGQGNIFPKELL